MLNQLLGVVRAHHDDFRAVPGPMNESRWEKMTPGDVVLIYNNRCIRFAGEIAAKVRNKDLAQYFWKENETGGTWELLYFIVNEERTNVPIEKLNPLFGYQSHYHPQGFSMINEAAVSSFAQSYGDILGVLKTLERGEELIHLPTRKEVLNANIDEHIERVSTEHDEMQWRDPPPASLHTHAEDLERSVLCIHFDTPHLEQPSRYITAVLVALTPKSQVRRTGASVSCQSQPSNFLFELSGYGSNGLRRPPCAQSGFPRLRGIVRNRPLQEKNRARSRPEERLGGRKQHY